MRAKSPKPNASGANPCIEITPTPTEYEQLCRDLAALRKAGAPSNTAAILQAVHAAGESHMLKATEAKRRAARTRPRHGTRRNP